MIELANGQPEILKTLAGRAGVTLPLWKERCDDEQRVKGGRRLASVSRRATIAHG
ncbi:hypothetical protein [Massilia rubra]|uniref:hypothetical protein n=1 Tax=Massilia rubra TaxID=2607910 RepID=UPI0014210450|nr:hypothetical protein [Massilia rubra]